MTRKFVAKTGWIIFIVLACAGLNLSELALAQTENPGRYRILKNPPIHLQGKVEMELFIDFYCPHCHHFEETVLPDLKKEFGEKLKVIPVGYPIIPNKPEWPFLLFEAARSAHREIAMEQILFRTLQDEKKDILDPGVEEKVLKEAKMTPAMVKTTLASGEPGRQLKNGIERANNLGVRGTPTALLDNYILVEDVRKETLRMLILRLLKGQEID